MDRQYSIAGTWMAADSSPNHLELARTDEPGVIAMRSTFRPDQVLFVTAGQLRGAISALESKPEFRQLVSS